MKKIFLIGIGGSGLSAIARLLLESGYQVMGSDQASSPILVELEKLGAKTFVGHRAEQVRGADLVIRSAAVPDSNPELAAAIAYGIPVLKRAAFLGEFLNEKYTIAVAGTHGKTTTTAMIAWILTAMREDVGYLIGGISRNLGRNAHAGKDARFVIEADEYDRMFLGLQPDLAVITNVEHDHPDLFPSASEYLDVFRQFTQQIKPGGTLLIGQEAFDRLAIAEPTGFRVVTFGPNPESDVRMHNLDLQSNGCYSFEINHKDQQKPPTAVKLCVPGMHNALNAAAALSVIDLLGLSSQEAAQHLAQYSGVERRFEIKGEINGITLVDDYAHHPTEIRSTLQAARDRFPQQRIIAVWQPHTFTRSKTLFTGFTQAFSDADEVLITAVYAAREQDPDFSASLLSDHMENRNVKYFAHMEELVENLAGRLGQGDVLIVLSAGNAISINEQLMQRFRSREMEVHKHNATDGENGRQE